MIIVFQSVIITVFNGSKWIQNCFTSIHKQTIVPEHEIEIVLFDDASVDDTVAQIIEWKSKFKEKNIDLILVQSEFTKPKGGKWYLR